MERTEYEETLGADYQFRERFEIFFRRAKDAEPYIRAVLERVDAPLSTRRFPVLGEGASASVYWLPDWARTLKLTGDPTDAYASEIVRKRPDPSLVKIYDVFQAIPGRLWGIVAEKLTPLPAALDNQWGWASRALIFQPPQPIWLTMKWVQRLEEVMATTNDPRAYRNITPEIISQLKVWAEALDARQIKLSDLKPENMMMRRNRLVFVDLGESKVRRVHIPRLKVS
jgi:serine/threonine protein kinase